MKNIDKAYLVLLTIFGIILFLGSIKSTFFPDESVYAPGKIVTLYDSESKSVLESYPLKTILKFDIDPRKLEANMFRDAFINRKNYCQQ